MAILPITKLGHPILRRPAQPVDLMTINTKKFHALMTDMIDTMYAARGVGIAAPQVGVDLQLAIINHSDTPFSIINPRILHRSFRSATSEEGCLSLPGVFGSVRRPVSVTVSYIDHNGTERTVEESGLVARVFQHEIDHLNGLLFIHRMKVPPKDLGVP